MPLPYERTNRQIGIYRYYTINLENKQAKKGVFTNWGGTLYKMFNKEPKFVL